MRIYRSIEIDMTSGRILRADFFHFHGRIALCGGSGGGSSTTNTVDYAYNDRMATLSEEQQDWARDYYNMWKDYSKPYEIAQTQANMALLPMETELYKNQLSAATTLLPQQTKAASAFLNAATSGVDVNERMAMATADAASAWKDVQGQTLRANARMGVNPNSGRFQGINAALDTQKAAQLAGARTQARVGAEQENFDRLKAAAGFNATGGILSGLGTLSG
ncbi:hypothetical protein [uncultured Desulfovibrio sp.]|uniref:hypothetical protein n=1 Tax=uncultured Desulfovibrio sp. TaxID=167968 RepID=UPI002631BAF4|nr:hypothetical protein [uncultured Desulfovibrio sp.]